MDCGHGESGEGIYYKISGLSDPGESIKLKHGAGADSLVLPHHGLLLYI